MKQSKSTQQLAMDAADALLEAGIRPTQQNVRDKIGTGSITTINKALNTWWKELGTRLKTQSSHPAIPDPLAEQMTKVWFSALEYAKKELNDAAVELERRYQQKLKEVKQQGFQDEGELKQLREQCMRLLADVESLSAEKRKISHDLALAENRLMALTAEKEQLERRIKQDGLMAGSAGKSIDEYIELKVENKLVHDENQKLKERLERQAQEKSKLTMALDEALEQIQRLKSV